LEKKDHSPERINPKRRKRRTQRNRGRGGVCKPK
jgi:hypothetical protein